jgi:RND family efflux transporter MFP subunit
MHSTLLRLSLTLSVMACGQDPLASREPAQAAVAAGTAPAAAPLPGVVASRATEVVAARIEGRITRVIARTGQRVHAGDPIAELDPTLLTERLRAASAAVDAARADLDGAAAGVNEAQRQVALEHRMFVAGATAEETVRIARATEARATATFDRAAAALREASASRATVESQLSYTQITAPIDGVVSLVKAQVGEIVATGAPIVRVFDPASLMIRFQVPRDRHREITVGAVVELKVAGADRPLRASVTSVSSDLEPPLDFSVAEADIADAGAAHDVQIGTLGDVRIIAAN